MNRFPSRRAGAWDRMCTPLVLALALTVMVPGDGLDAAQLRQVSGEGERDSLILQWNQAALTAVRNTPSSLPRQLGVVNNGPTIASHGYALLNTAIYDTWAAYDDTAVPVVPSNRRLAAPDGGLETAISHAAYTLLKTLYPEQEPGAREVMLRLGYDPDIAPDESSHAARFGRTVTRNLLEFRSEDGSHWERRYQPVGAYASYEAVNEPLPIFGEWDPSRVKDANRWQPLRRPDGRVQTYATPHWGDVKPFALDDQLIEDLRPPCPPIYGDEPVAIPGDPGKVCEPDPEGYVEQFDALIEYSANLTDERKIIAEWWEDGPGTYFPPGKWIRLGMEVARRDTLVLEEQIQLLFLLSNAVFDAGIICWEVKWYYDFVRPITALRYLHSGETIVAWGGQGEGTQEIDGGDWLPYQARWALSPPFPEYVSGHSAFSHAAAEILKRFTGSDEFGYSAKIDAGASRFEPTITPAEPMVLSWATFSEAAAQAGESRRFGGIHIPLADLRGRELGREVAEVVWERGMQYIRGEVE